MITYLLDRILKKYEEQTEREKQKIKTDLLNRLSYLDEFDN